MNPHPRLARATSRRLAVWALPLAALGVPCGAIAQIAAHTHGVAALDIAVEPGRLTLRLELPQEALLGHERAPRSAAERQAAAAALARLRGTEPLWHIDPALGCTLQMAQVDAPLLDAGAATKHAGEHADVVAIHVLACTGDTTRLRRIDVGALLDAFARIASVRARIAGTGAQHRAGLRRPERTLTWGR